MNVIQGSAFSAEPEQAPSSSAYPGAGGPYGSYGGSSEGSYGSGGSGRVGSAVLVRRWLVRRRRGLVGRELVRR